MKKEIPGIVEIPIHTSQSAMMQTAIMRRRRITKATLMGRAIIISPRVYRA